MNVLPRDKQIAIISALVEGVSIRATERLTGVHRDSIMRLGARVGGGAMKVHDGLMRNLNVARIELDEAWSYVGKKQRKLKPSDSADLGEPVRVHRPCGVRQDHPELPGGQAGHDDHAGLPDRSSS